MGTELFLPQMYKAELTCKVVPNVAINNTASLCFAFVKYLAGERVCITGKYEASDFVIAEGEICISSNCLVGFS